MMLINASPDQIRRERRRNGLKARDVTIRTTPEGVANIGASTDAGLRFVELMAKVFGEVYRPARDR